MLRDSSRDPQDLPVRAVPYNGNRAQFVNLEPVRATNGKEALWEKKDPQKILNRVRIRGALRSFKGFSCRQMALPESVWQALTPRRKGSAADYGRRCVQ